MTIDIEKLAKESELNIASQTWEEVYNKLKQFAEAYHKDMYEVEASSMEATVLRPPLKRFDESEKEKAQLKAHINVLRDALQNILDGNYPSPRTDRGKQCAHGKYYWEDCTDCIDDYIQPILASTPAQSLQAHDDEVIERCAKVAMDWDITGIAIADAIRALKGE